ncbi:tryptophan synthase subunit alpha [Helicobacter sp. CLO-3]|nr:tryptophan synthase subunit alpha [Helicobacter sp. CLO-3]OHU83360.1 tryptophan synthase subunit alpha [Helicobacter sp. CLO-3]
MGAESSAISSAFAKRKAFIPFVTCGDPSLDFTERAVCTLIENGADIIELGIPFSDPVAEGATIQAASARALANGANVEKIFALVSRIRSKSQIPLVFMNYANMVFSYGSEAFLDRCAALGVNGLILPDVPYEEKGEFAPFCEKAGVDFISLIAPTSEKRIDMIAKEARGFVYCVSSLGVTGVRDVLDGDIRKNVARIKRASGVPVAVGFGISTPEQVRQVAQYADGVIIGSAIVKICANGNEASLKQLATYAQEIRNALDS